MGFGFECWTDDGKAGSASACLLAIAKITNDRVKIRLRQ
jgi:hypothetical protein